VVSGLGVLPHSRPAPFATVQPQSLPYLAVTKLTMERGRLSVLWLLIAGLYGGGVGGGNGGKRGIFVLSVCLCFGYFFVLVSREEDEDENILG